MFLLFTLVLLVVAVGILSSVYSIFFPFLQNLGTVNQYHMAYYGAVSSIERGELALRYRLPGFVGSGGFIGSTGYGPLSDYTPELLSGPQQGFWWTVDSRTTSIPRTGMGNTDPMLSDPTSKDYNQIGYVDLETFLLSYDDTSDPDLYYTGGTNLVFFSGDGVTGVFRLPPKIFSGFGGGTTALLCDAVSYLSECDPDGDNLNNDVVLSWSMEGLYQGRGFKIFPTMAVFLFQDIPYINPPNDNTIRESLINATGFIDFTNSYTPINNDAPLNNGNGLSQHNVVAQDADLISGQNFQEIFHSSDFSDLRLAFGATNIFYTFTGTIYPYLEYQFTFPQAIADRFYTIVGHGRVGEYDVQIIVKKPTTKRTVGGDFTVIF